MKGSPTKHPALKPMVSVSMTYSQSMLDHAPKQIDAAIANLVSRLMTNVSLEGFTVNWDSLKVETRYSNPRAMWTTTASIEEVRNGV